MSISRKLSVFLLPVVSILASPLVADTVAARCDIYPKGSDHLDKMLACDFSQRQGYIHIRREDGIEYDLSPVGDRPGNFVDANGKAAYRQSGLGSLGHIYRLSDVSIFVYWDTSALNPPTSREENATWPFTTRDYDATSLFRCGKSKTQLMDTCSAGIKRHAMGRADIDVMLPGEQKVQLQFNGELLSVPEHSASWQIENDTWKIVIDGQVTVEVPDAAINGG